MKKYAIVVENKFMTEDQSFTEIKEDAFIIDDLDKAYSLMKRMSNKYGKASIIDMNENESIAIIMK